jgi:hypothetical protein
LLRKTFKHTRDSKISNFSIIIEDITELKLWELAADDGSYVEGLVVIQCARVFERGWEGGALRPVTRFYLISGTTWWGFGATGGAFSAVSMSADGGAILRFDPLKT